MQQCAYFSIPVKASSDNVKTVHLDDVFPIRRHFYGASCYTLEWTTALVKTIHMLSRTVEKIDTGLSPTFIYRIVAKASSKRCFLRLSASKLALKFLCILFSDDEGWNEPDFYFNDRINQPELDSISVFTPHHESSCSRLFAVFAENYQATRERRAFWKYVKKLEDLMFCVVSRKLKKMQCPWSRLTLTITSKRSQELRTLLKEVTKAMQEEEEATTAQPPSPISVVSAPSPPQPPPAPPPPPPARQDTPPPPPPPPPLKLLIKGITKTSNVPVNIIHEHLRSCNFPPRNGLFTHAIWDTSGPLSGIIWGHAIDQTKPILVPRGMSAPASEFVSIW
jgi:hypothetical protein